ncbi:MAG TPA: hypothetical protein VFF73_22900 [Planctomycetota bacterium]|nr:hypothetical protein [Planctomycetota bacterium]
MPTGTIVGLLVLFIILLASYDLWRSLSWGLFLGQRRYASLPLLQEDLERLTGLRPLTPRLRAWHRSLVFVDLGGTLPSGRRANVDFTVDLRARFAVAADRIVSLYVSRRPCKVWLGLAREEVSSGDPDFDARYVVAAVFAPSAQRALSHGLKGAIETVFAYPGVESLEVSDGWLTATFPASSVEPESYPRFLEVLERAAVAFDRVPILVHGLGIEVSALAGPGGTARCAYCHDGLSGEDPDLVACDRCHTVLHAGCWEELSHCPVLGCVGREPRRARERA